MSSIRCEPSLRIEPQPSSILKYLLIANFSGVTIILLCLFPIFFALLSVVLLWAYFYQLYRHNILRSTPSSIRLLVRETEGEWLLCTHNGEEREVTLSSSSYIHPQIIILILQAEGQRYILPLLHDSLSKECFRALSVRLKASGGV
jgi:hypothetical protein